RARPPRRPARARVLAARALRQVLPAAPGLPRRAAGPHPYLDRLHEQLHEVLETDRDAEGQDLVTLNSGSIIALHDGGHAASTSDLWRAIADNHRLNDLLWKEEDLARRRSVPDSEIAKNKRNIDGYNQQRNDSIERIDETLLKALSLKADSR